MLRLVYIIGQPGSGKSTLLGATLAGLRGEAVKEPVPHVRYENGAQLGVVRPRFPGTDAMSMSIQPKVLDWMQGGEAPSILVGEGDRLATASFFTQARLLADQFSVVYLDTPDSVAAARRWARGSRQDPKWVQGRISKVRDLAARFGTADWHLCGTEPVETLVAKLQRHPIIADLINPKGVA